MTRREATKWIPRSVSASHHGVSPIEWNRKVISWEKYYVSVFTYVYYIDGGVYIFISFSSASPPRAYKLPASVEADAGSIEFYVLSSSFRLLCRNLAIIS